ncbi:MAG: amino acid--tRNA ligase-related protein, partial [Myxococcota bacterium]
GFEHIWQLGPAWRDGEVTDRHLPEFTILEWYRAWEGVEAIMEDVEHLTRLVLGGTAKVRNRNTTEENLDIDLGEPFLRRTMQQLYNEACGFDILEALTYESLLHACRAHALLDLDRSTGAPHGMQRWDALFFELHITYVEPLIASLGTVFVTEWPTPLAVLARRDERDPRVAKRFELYVGGVELANGFEELTDPIEQRTRFEEDLTCRAALEQPPLPMPESFLATLERGLPPSAGVAMGFDRMVMLALGAATIQEVAPLSTRRDPVRGGITWV